jgi:membrane protease YdiL (CAAX protease family)
VSIRGKIGLAERDLYSDEDRRGGKLGQESHTRWQGGWPCLIALLVVAALMPWPLLITQDNWWAFILVSAAIVGALRLLFGPQWTSHAGLKVSPVQALIAIAAFALIATGSKMLLHHVYEAARLRADTLNIEGQTGFVFQAFNEEIFFRALMIGFFIQYVRSPLVISLGLAFLFAAAHFLLYRFGTLHMALSMASLATLFLAGVAWNNLYLAFRHIGFSWALHAGWNVVWLPAVFYDASTNERLYEPQVFDRVLGSPAILAMACAMAVLSFVLLARGQLTSKVNP